jgi:hypothetical protein
MGRQRRLLGGDALDVEKRLSIEPAGFRSLSVSSLATASVVLHYPPTTASELYVHGHQTRIDRPWATGGITDTLRSRSYLGEVFWRGRCYSNSKAPFIEPRLFERAQVLLASGRS